VLWVALLNIEWVLVASMIHYSKAQAPAAAKTTPVLESAGV
jgi:hypothetical protein